MSWRSLYSLARMRALRPGSGWMPKLEALMNPSSSTTEDSCRLFLRCCPVSSAMRMQSSCSILSQSSGEMTPRTAFRRRTTSRRLHSSACVDGMMREAAGSGGNSGLFKKIQTHADTESHDHTLPYIYIPQTYQQQPSSLREPYQRHVRTCGRLCGFLPQRPESPERPWQSRSEVLLGRGKMLEK